MKDRRNTVDKLKTLLFGKDLRITKGDAYPSVYDYDFSSYYPQEEYIKLQRVPSDNVYDIRDFGACLIKSLSFLAAQAILYEWSPTRSRS